MDLLDLMDAIQVHALEATVAIDAKFYDVAVGFPASKGRCVRIFYGGEREPEHFEGDKVLTAQLVAQAIVVRAYWPLNETAAKRHRLIEGEMSAFVKGFRTRILGDSQLGGEGSDLNMHHAVTDQLMVAQTQYAVADIEIVCDYDEHTINP